MAETDATNSIAEPRPQVIAAASTTRVIDEPGMRPLPWPIWRGRGSPRRAIAIGSLWLLSVSVGLIAKALAVRGLSPDPSQSAIVSSFLLHVPWTLSLLWLFYGGFNYAMLLTLSCAVAVQNPTLGPWFSEPFALAVFAGIQTAFPFDTRLMRLTSIGLFAFAAYCAAVATSMSELLRGGNVALSNWELHWLAHFAEDIVITWPLAVVCGGYIERRKRLAFGSLPEFRTTVRQQFLALLLSLITIMAFCITWTVAADLSINMTIREVAADPQSRLALTDAQRSSAFRKGALVAMLLGAVSGGASLVILVFRRYREELRAEVRLNTENLRRRHLQLATLQQVTESANRSLDPVAVYRELAQCLARLTDAAQVAIYIPDPVDNAFLKLVDQISIRPAEFPRRERLAINGSMTGQCYSTGSLIAVPRGLPLYIDDEAVRAHFTGANLDAFLAVPIVGERGTLGVANLAFDRAYSPEEEENRLFRLIGRAVGAALERAETHTKARRYAGDLGGLYRFSQQLANESEEPKLLAVAAPAARRLLSAQSSAIFLVVNEGKNTLVRCVGSDGAQEKTNQARELSLKLEDAGLICETIREVRTTGVGVRSLSRTPQTLGGNWSETSALVVPLPTAEHESGPAGALVLTFDGHLPIGLEDAGLAEEVARQTAAGLRRARLIEKTRQQANELKLLEHIGRSMSQRLTMSHTLEQTVQNVNKIISAKWASVFVLDPLTQTIRARATNMVLPGARDISIPLTSQSFVVTCLKEGRTLVSPDMQNDPRCNPELNKKFQTASGICVPLGPAGQRFGVLMVNNSEPCQFHPDDVRRLEQVAQLASAAIERARLYEEACQRADELILLNEVGHLLVENPALESTLQRIAELVTRNFQLGGAGFLILNEGRNALISRGIAGNHSPVLKHLRIPLNVPDVTTQAFHQNQVLMIENGATDKRVHRMLFKLLPGAVSGAVIPMAGTAGPVGILGVWKTHGQPFQPRDLQCLNGVARLAASSVGRDELGQALRASEKRLQEVVDGIHAMIVSIDPRGRILSFNAAAERVSGLKREAVLGQFLASVVSPRPSERVRLETALTQAFMENDCSKELILNWTTPDGRERKIRWSSSFLLGPEGRPTGMVCLGVDITEQTLLEAQLLQAQKMESVGTLAGGMAHDFNNLLGGIIGQCTLAKAQSDDELMLGALAKIESAAQRGADLTAKLMAFARKSVLQPRAIDIGALIKETTDLLSPSLPRTIHIVTDFPSNLPRVQGDPTQLQQVVLNLCVNARDAMPNGGTLTLSATPISSVAASSSSELPAVGPANPGVQLTIQDTGTGMTEEVQRHLFEPFFTTKEPGKGTGLGLSVVFGIVRSHGGQIVCESKLGQGTRFIIRLMGARPQTTIMRAPNIFSTDSQADLPAVHSASSPAALFAGSEKIMLVDDDAILRDTVRQLLLSLGYNVRTAAGGVDLISQLDRNRDFVPAIILLDVVMPGLAGLPLYRELRKRMPDVPVILMSGYSTDQTVQALLDAGARELIQKPFTLERLAGAMRHALTHSPTRKADVS